MVRLILCVLMDWINVENVDKSMYNEDWGIFVFGEFGKFMLNKSLVENEQID